VVSVALFLAPQHAYPGQGAKQPAKVPTLTQLWTLDATYSDPEHGVTFRYPSAWDATTAFGYHVPALSDYDETEPIAGFGYEAGGFPRDRTTGPLGPYLRTTLEGFGLVYSALPGANMAACESRAAAVSRTEKHTHTVLAGRPFSVYETGEGGMSQYISGYLYATYTSGTCYWFETGLAVVVSGVADGSKRLTTAQTRSIEAHLLQIMRSVRIQPK
jgi:hypothetical protein